MGSDCLSLRTLTGSGTSLRIVFGTTAVMVVLSGSVFADEEVGPALPTITWDAGSVRLVAENGEYRRMVRLDDGRIACVYDRDRRMWIRHGDERRTLWGAPVLVSEEPECWLTNADMLPLRDGTLLYFWDERPVAALAFQHRAAPPGRLTRPFRIRMARSADRGRTWSPPRTIHTAGPSYQDGCWEPAAIQLPSGEIQVFFADESRFRITAEQETLARWRNDLGTGRAVLPAGGAPRRDACTAGARRWAWRRRGHRGRRPLGWPVQTGGHHRHAGEKGAFRGRRRRQPGAPGRSGRTARPGLVRWRPVPSPASLWRDVTLVSGERRWVTGAVSHGGLRRRSRREPFYSQDLPAASGATGQSVLELAAREGRAHRDRRADRHRGRGTWRLDRRRPRHSRPGNTRPGCDDLTSQRHARASNEVSVVSASVDALTLQMR